MDNLGTFWQELVTAALLGTDRRPIRLNQPGGELGRLIEALHSQADEDDQAVEDSQFLLRAVAASALHRQAGYLPAAGHPDRLVPCPDGDLPRCSRQAGSYLERILTGGQMIKLLPEWVRLAAAKGQRVREEHLAPLLEKQKAIAPLRAELLPVLGERGRWLAAQNPEWSTFRWYQDEAIWFEGSQKERLAFLEDQRGRDPDRARTLLESTWDQETPANKTLFLQALNPALSMADEPFLENALNDRRAEVRQASASLLACLPQSRLVQRMTKRAQSLLTWKPGLLRSTLEVKLPETCPEDLLRDGLATRPPANIQMGEKVWWLAQIMAAVPPVTWRNAWGRRLAALLETAARHEYGEALLSGWQEAAIRHADSDWMDALLLIESRRADPKRMYEVFSRLPEAQRDKTMLAMLRDELSLSYDQPASICLSACRFPWSGQLTQTVTRSIYRTLRKGDIQPWLWEALLREIGVYFHPDLLDQSAAQLEDAQQKLGKNAPRVRNLINMLHFRLEMHRSFA